MIKDKKHFRNVMKDVFDSIDIKDIDNEMYSINDFIDYVYKRVIEENKTLEEVFVNFETKGRFYLNCKGDYAWGVEYEEFVGTLKNIINAFLKNEICYSCYKKNGKYVYEEKILCEKCLEQTITHKLTKVVKYKFGDKVYDNVKDTFENFDINKVKEN